MKAQLFSMIILVAIGIAMTQTATAQYQRYVRPVAPIWKPPQVGFNPQASRNFSMNHQSNNGIRWNGSYRNGNVNFSHSSPYRDRYGNQQRQTWNGYGNIHSKDRFKIGFNQSNHLNSYGGFINHRPGNTQVHGNYSRPGTIPFTKENYYGGANFRGRNSNLYSGGSIQTNSGQRLGGMHQNLNGRGYVRRNDGGLGGARGNQNTYAQFQGINSRFAANQNTSLGGVVRQNVGASVSRHGVNAKASMGIGRNNIGISGSFTNRGPSVKVHVPKPKAPRSLSVGGKKLLSW